MPPGASLPSDTTCASQVRRTASEPRPENTVANNTVPTPGSFTLAPLNDQVGYDNRAQALEGRVTGNFTGKTDEIIQWASCKWGFDEDIVRAIAVTESYWRQSQLGDAASNPESCPPGYTIPCPQSFGIHQMTWTGDPRGTFPWSRDSTAFNLDVSLLVHRICFEGYTTYLRDIGYTSYQAGDEWGCVGQWYSGNWHDAGAESYIATVKDYLARKPWLSSSFATVATTTTTTSQATTTTTTPQATTTTAPQVTTTTTTAAACCVRTDFEDGTTQGWYRAWGPLSVGNTSSPVNTGSRALAVLLGPAGPDWPAIERGAPAGLSSGRQVTYWLHAPSGSTLSSVQPYVADLGWNDVFTSAVRLAPGWNKVTWTVPAVNGINAIGLLFNDDSGWNGQITLDTVSW